MRLIDADKLQVKHYLQRSEHPIGYEGTQAVYDYKDVLAYDIESAETVEAIPIDWLLNKLLEYDLLETHHTICCLWERWKEENETDRCE